MNINISAATRTWWEGVKADSQKLNHWLQKQYHGEATAAERIGTYLLGASDLPHAHRNTLLLIEEQERRHARWILQLLENRGLVPMTPPDADRYWRETITAEVQTFAECAAVAAQAESMRLERIALIASDADAPEDIRNAFLRILPEEQFHAKAFLEMSSDEALAKTAPNHLRGLLQLGLLTPDMV